MPGRRVDSGGGGCEEPPNAHEGVYLEDLHPQVPDCPGPLQRGQLVIPAGLLLAVEPQDGPAGRHPLGWLVVVFIGRWRRISSRGGDSRK